MHDLEPNPLDVARGPDVESFPIVIRPPSSYLRAILTNEGELPPEPTEDSDPTDIRDLEGSALARLLRTKTFLVLLLALFGLLMGVIAEWFG
jgi:hypothetical protein